MIRLTGKKLAVEPIFDSLMSSGGLHIPESAVERCDQGIVKYIGPECVDTSVGDYVLFSGYTGTTVRLEGEGVLIIFHEDFVTCKINDADTEVPGLFFKDRDGVYFESTFEMAMGIIGRAFSDSKLAATKDRKENKPKRDEIKRGI